MDRCTYPSRRAGNGDREPLLAKVTGSARGSVFVCIEPGSLLEWGCGPADARPMGIGYNRLLLCGCALDVASRAAPAAVTI
jgi:hypothetical protein